ncbi:hypothetical protein BOX15_Mlig027357g1 [Macrostomum lignano]|uniref:TLC domain-containing protein n=1 Tax=Macrostomum lignano TaxID=282301 RepID=A0A267H475_9PLAT|nr:hypothetical protein BOX15_Mlig027357g1 [Macrostomum lignano]
MPADLGCSASTGRLAAEVAFAFACWTGAYKFLAVFGATRHFSREWRCRMVTVAHACLVTALAGWDLASFRRNAVYWEMQGQPYNCLERLLFTVCLGYFRFDLAWCLLHRTEGPLMLLHHCASVFGLAMSLFGCRWAPELTITIGGSECTNPLLQMRWFLRNSGRGNSPLRSQLLLVVELTFLVSFCLMRLCVGGCLTVSYLANPATDFLGRLGAVTMFGIGLGFLGQVFGQAARRIRRAKSGENLQRLANLRRDEGEDDAAANLRLDDGDRILHSNNNGFQLRHSKI